MCVESFVCGGSGEHSFVSNVVLMVIQLADDY